jgi:uncharacterized membrane protein YkvA (DUF1232 family)
MTTFTAASTDHSFDQDGFFRQLATLATRAGSKVVEKVLVAYYVAIDSSTPTWAQASLIGALVYFGFPIDAVPDTIPVVGFSDDLTVLALALAGVATSIRMRHVRAAKRTMRTWGMKGQESNPDLADDDPAPGFTHD